MPLNSRGSVSARLSVWRSLRRRAANAAVVDVVARWLGVPRSRVRLVAGEKSREKRLHVAGDAGALAAALEAKLRA